MNMNKIFDVDKCLNNTNKSYVIEDNDCVSSYYFDLDSGYGTMTYYHVFEGIELIYNNFKSENCKQLNQYFYNQNNIIINHCNKGRFEASLDNQVIYLGEGDLSCSYVFPSMISSFPLGYYSGVEILINKDVAQKSLDDFIGHDIDLNVLTKKIDENNQCFIIRSKKEIDHIISELYNVNNSIKNSYFKLKIVEFLLFLSIEDLNENIEPQKHVSKKQAVIIHDIKDYLTDNISDSITLDELASKFNISKTSIKNSFKIMYGKSVFKWRQEYRLQVASTMLKETDLSIKTISQNVGYQNHSKFTARFKSYYGVTPSEYRNQ